MLDEDGNQVAEDRLEIPGRKYESKKLTALGDRKRWVMAQSNRARARRWWVERGNEKRAHAL